MSSVFKRITNVPALGALAFVNFRWLVTAALISSIARQGETVLFGWLTLELTGSPFKTGVVVALRSAGYVLSPIAGIVADRYDRRKVMQLVLTSSATYTLALAILITTGNLQYWHLMIISTIGSLGNAFDNPIRKTLAADLVPPRMLSSAYAMTVLATDSMAIIGPSAAGLMIGAVGAVGVVWVNLAVYVSNIGSFAMMKVPPLRTDARKATPWSNLVDGVKHTWSNQAVLGLIIISIIANALPMSARGSLFPVFAKQVYNMGPSGLGFLVSAAGIGGLTGSTSAVFFGTTRHKAKISIATCLLMGVVLILFAWSPFYALALLIAGMLGFCSSVFLTLSNALLLQLAPQNMRGRVMGVRGMVLLANLPGALFAGALASAFGARGAGVVIGITCLIATTATAMLIPAMARSDKKVMQVEEEGETPVASPAPADPVLQGSANP